MLPKPEDVIKRVYQEVYAPQRTQIFYLLFVLALAMVFIRQLHIPVSKELFIWTLGAMVKILLAVGGITAGFVTIAVGMVKNKTQAVEVNKLWDEISKYIIYPFAIVVLIGSVLLLVQGGLNFPNISLSAGVLIFFGYLVINSFFGIIKASEILINENWSEKAIFKSKKEKYPPEKLNITFKLFQFPQQFGRIYIYDIKEQRRYWIHDMQTLVELGYKDKSWITVNDGVLAPGYEHFDEGEDIISPLAIYNIKLS